MKRIIISLLLCPTISSAMLDGDRPEELYIGINTQLIQAMRRNDSIHVSPLANNTLVYRQKNSNTKVGDVLYSTCCNDYNPLENPRVIETVYESFKPYIQQITINSYNYESHIDYGVDKITRGEKTKLIDSNRINLDLDHALIIHLTKNAFTSVSAFHKLDQTVSRIALGNNAQGIPSFMPGKTFMSHLNINECDDEDSAYCPVNPYARDVFLVIAALRMKKCHNDNNSAKPIFIPAAPASNL